MRDTNDLPLQTESKPMQPDLFQQDPRLFDKVCDPYWLAQGFKAVRKNRGAPGIDGQTTDDFGQHLEQELSSLAKELASWTYKPQPVKRVEIPKPDGGVRLLGIQCVRDRVANATLKLLLEPLLVPQFSKHSFGFIPGRNQKQAVTQAQSIVRSGKEYVVDIDLSKFFDRIHHDRLIARLSLSIQDKRILRLIGLILRSGIMQDGLVTATTIGSVQGSPLSPLLSNVVLDELDKELESRGLSFCRFADDCNIFVRTKTSAERVMKSVTRFIEKTLKLVVNQQKSQVARSEKVRFLGMTIVNGNIAISLKSIQRAMDKTRELTPRGTHLTLEQTVEAINRWYRGWSSYYSLTQYPAQLRKIEAHLRRRLRSRLIDQQKSRRNLFRKLVKRGVPKSKAGIAYSNHGRWHLSSSKAASLAYPNRWFTHTLGLYTCSSNKLEHWSDDQVWIRLM